MMVIQEVLSFTQNKSEKHSFRPFFNIVLFNINVLSPTIIKHCNVITKEDYILVDKKFIHNSYDLFIDSKMVTTLVGFELR